MSYSGYNQLSPYWQPPTTQQENSNHYSNPSNTSRPNGSYSSSPYQPLSAYQSQNERHQLHNQSHPTSQSTANYNNSSYIDLNPSGGSAGRPMNSYGNQVYGEIGTSTAGQQDSSTVSASSCPDTTALGKLAYASSLGQNQQQPSLSQIIDYNRTQGKTDYGGTNGYGVSSVSPVSGNPQLADAGASSKGGAQQISQVQPSSASLQPTNGRSPYKGQVYGMNDTGRKSPAQQHFTPPPSHQQQSQAYRQNQYGQPPRPASGQALQRPSSPASVHSNQSPQVPAAKVPVPNRQQNHNQASQSATSRAYRPTSLTPQLQTPTHKVVSSHQSNETSKGQEQVSAQGGHDKNQDKKSNSTLPRTINTQIARASQQSTPTESQHPTTVDPNQVFNHYEYQRRQIEAETARKAAEEGKAAVIARMPTSAQTAGQSSPSAPSDDVTQAAKAIMGASANANPNPNADAATKEQIELEMKQMIEKMRDYKAKDPTLFSQVWEQVKKGQPPQPAPSQTNPQSSTALLVTDQSVRPTQADLPAESDLPAASLFPSDLDRGRYPMQRRRRGNKTYTPEKRPTHHKKSTGALNSEYAKGTATPSTNLGGAQHVTGDVLEQSKHISAPVPPLSPKPKQPKAAQAQSTTSPPAGTTYWPEHKKRALADAARSALTSTPLNFGKSVTSDEIHALLDQNPSYSQMCEHLENRGFVIDRGQFARLLLAAVPDLNSATPNNTAKPQVSASQPQAPLQQTPQVPSLPIPQSPSHDVLHGYKTPYAPLPSGQQQSFATKDYRFVDQSLRQESGLVKGEPDSTHPQSKQEKARKRSFGDIIDLTTFSDDEDFTRYRPQLRVENSKPPDQKYFAQGPAFTSGPFNSIQRPPLTPRPLGQSSADTFKPNRSGREHLLYDMVVEPMNKRRDALRRSSYDTKTICRDILIGSGKHPTMAPLNQHLDALREKFVSVDNNADLSTFRWDLVDPGGHPPPVSVPVARRKAEDAENHDADDEDASLAHVDIVPRPQVAVKVGGLGVGSGRPDFATRPTNVPIGRPRKGRPPKQNRPASGIPKDTIPPSDTPQPGPPKAPITFDEVRRDAVNIPGTSFAPIAGIHLDPIKSAASTPSSTPARVPGRIGRPPGARNKQSRPDKGVGKKGRPPIDSNPVFATISSQPNRETSTPVRQSGLRNVMTPTSGIAIVIPSRSPSIADIGSAKQGKGVIKPEESRGRHPSESSYKVYKCHWQHCPAELHNLDTLRKHVRKQHRERLGNGPWQCRWADCFDHTRSDRNRHLSHEVDVEAHQSGNENGQGRRLTFELEKAWDMHVERKHLGIGAQELGDGPGPYPFGAESSDSPKAYANPTPEETMKAYTDAPTARKTAIGGMGIYKTGSSLATDSKRRILATGGIISDEEIKEVKGGDGTIEPSRLNEGTSFNDESDVNPANV